MSFPTGWPSEETTSSSCQSRTSSGDGMLHLRAFSDVYPAGDDRTGRSVASYSACSPPLLRYFGELPTPIRDSPHAGAPDRRHDPMDAGDLPAHHEGGRGSCGGTPLTTS